MPAKRAVGRPWTAHEDQLLANAVAVHGQVDNWKAVALSVPGRSNKACRKRWLHSLSPSVKKTAWTKEEDNLLLELYKIHAAKWALIARNIPGRTDDACSKRYREALDPALKKDVWSDDEDERLVAAYGSLGGQWGRVGQELQRSGLACRNRWRLLERKRHTAPPQKVSQPLHSFSAWPALPMIDCWHPTSSNPAAIFPGDPPPPQHPQHVQPAASRPVDFPPSFHYPSSSLSPAFSSPQHPLPYEKDPESAPDATQSLLIPPSVQDTTSPAVFAPFDYESSSSACALSVGSTSPVPQPAYSEDMHQRNVYNDCPHQFHQLQRTLPHTAIPAHPSSVHPVHVDHYAASIPHEECSLSHAALTTRHQPSPQSSSANSYFTSPRLPEQQASHMPSPMTSVSLLDNPDAYYHVSSKPPRLDVNPQHPVPHTPDPLSLSESPPAYHYSLHRDFSRARGVQSVHAPEQHADYHHNHVLPDQVPRQPSRPLTNSPPQSRYAPHQLEPRNVNTPLQPEAGPSRATPDIYYNPTTALSSQLVRRSTASPLPMSMPYPKRPSSQCSSEDYASPSSVPILRRKMGSPVSRKRPDAQAPLRLSSDLQATPDSSVKPYACGHESCWPTNAASSRACYCTSRGLSDHNKNVHSEDGGGDRPYRCGLEGCGKSWKSINGLQYHLQISKAHFQHAITSSFVCSYIDGLAVEEASASASAEGEDRTKKQYKCPHENCPNRYKQLSGLRYHLAHGHPVDLPKQLDLVPPALSRKLAEKMRTQGSSSSERQVRDNGSEASIYTTQRSFNS